MDHDQEKEQELEEALDRWQEEYEDGHDLGPRELCPGWPDEWLKVLNDRIELQREVLSMFDDTNQVDAYQTTFTPGAQVPDNPDYFFEKRLGGGGFGEAWLAKNEGMGKQAVFKFCSPPTLNALKNERELLKRIRNQLQKDQRFIDGFVQMLDTHVTESPYYVQYEYVPEGNLRQYMNKLARPFTPIEALEIMLQLAEAMALVHTLPDPIVHRDLKPENILVVSSDSFPPRLKIGDFGIGGVLISTAITERKATKDYAKAISGYTPGYASWQQEDDPCRRKTRDDVHALAVIWNELLTGKIRPRSGEKWESQLRQIGVPDAQIEFLKECLGDDESSRPENAAVMADQIRLFLRIQEEIARDYDDLCERKRAGGNWRQHFKRLAETQMNVWATAAGQGLASAQWLAGIASQLQEDYDEAAKSFLKAAQQGDAEAKYMMACYQRLGLGGFSKINRPITALGLSVRTTNCLESDNIGTIDELTQRSADDLIEVRNFGETNLTEVREKLASIGLQLQQPDWLERAAGSGHLAAQYELGLRCWEIDRREAIGVLRSAANRGHLESQVFLAGKVLPAGAQHPSASEDLPTYRECLAWLDSAANSGHGEACFLLGKCFEAGDNDFFSRDDEESAMFYRIAAESGHLEAQSRLSRCLCKKLWDQIECVEKDGTKVPTLGELFQLHPELVVLRNEALRWCVTAASRGHVDAQFLLGRSLFDALEEPPWMPILFQEPAEAISWLCRAAIQSHAEAVEYITGDFDFVESASEYPELRHTLHVIANTGHAGAAFALAYLYSLTDIGTYEDAREWLQKAAQWGNDRAIDLIMKGFDNIPEDWGLDEEDEEEEDDEEDEEEEQEDEAQRKRRLRCSYIEKAEQCEKKGDLAEAVWWYQMVAEQKYDEEAAKDVASLGDMATRAIMDSVLGRMHEGANSRYNDGGDRVEKGAPQGGSAASQEEYAALKRALRYVGLAMKARAARTIPERESATSQGEVGLSRYERLLGLARAEQESAASQGERPDLADLGPPPAESGQDDKK